MFYHDDDVVVSCPNCGADTAIDVASIADYEERAIVDCSICCNPLQVFVSRTVDGEVQVDVRLSDS